MTKLWMAMICALLALPTIVWADEDGSYVNYDNLVNELKTAANEKPPVERDPSDFGWEEVAIHGGLGLATTWTSLTTPGGVHGEGILPGLTMNFGINLFSKHWRAEGAFSSFSQGPLDGGLKAQLKEFELRALYLPPVQDNLVLRIGAGVVARYMSVDSESFGQWANYQTTTPSSLLLVGFERKMSKSVSLGPDVSYRSALVSDSFDKSGWDASFRLNATF